MTTSTLEAHVVNSSSGNQLSPPPTSHNNGNSSSSNNYAVNTQQTTNTTTAAATTTAATNNNNNSSSSNNNYNNNATRAMQSDEDFNIRFVNLVRQHKCLYDKKVPEYRNRDNQEKAWLLISQDSKESVIHCKERWRNLRACLSRYIKQQHGNEPQHKPYYLTEHMAFLLPFLKSTRNGVLDCSQHSSGSLSNTLFQISQQQQQALQQSTNGISLLHATLPAHQTHLSYDFNSANIMAATAVLKHSLSEQDDEETIDAFDPAVTASLQQQQQQHMPQSSTPLSDTISANTLQHFIPDVQLSELRSNDMPQDLAFHHLRHTPNSSSFMEQEQHEAKRVKTECFASEATTTAAHYSMENADMEFFRSILPDLATLTPQQKRKFKIGILELIDDVLERYPSDRSSSTGSSKQRRNSSRDWRK